MKPTLKAFSSFHIFLFNQRTLYARQQDCSGVVVSLLRARPSPGVVPAPGLQCLMFDDQRTSLVSIACTSLCHAGNYLNVIRDTKYTTNKS